eukprot:sb/3468117/
MTTKKGFFTKSIMSDLSFNKLNVSDSLDELASNINQIQKIVVEIEKLKKQVGTTCDNEELWQKFGDIHSTFQRKLSRCQKLLLTYVWPFNFNLTIMSDLSFNKLNVSDSLDELASNINQIQKIVVEIEKLKKQVGTTCDNEELWQKFGDIHSTFQRKLSRCQKLISSRERGVIKRSRTNSARSSESGGGGGAGADQYDQLQDQEHLWLDGQEILEREQQIKKIEDDMVTVADMMREIGYLVHDQALEKNRGGGILFPTKLLGGEKHVTITY